MARVAVITGAASGFGRALALRWLAAGDRVVALDEDPAEDWRDALRAAGTCLALRCDVRTDADVTSAVAEARGFGAVDRLVNNAGYGAFASQEEGDLARFRDLFEVNVLGVARITRALLPELRRHAGAVVQLASVAGRTVFAESGFYAATKHAVEAMSEALAQEVCTFGVRVRVIEPGAFATGFGARATAVSPAAGPDSPYAEVRERWTAAKAAVLEAPQDPALVVDAILASLADPAPFRRVPVGRDAARILALRERLGADGWTRLALDRNGYSGPHGPGEVPSAEEFLALAPNDPRVALARAADDAGHLDHWALEDHGPAALARLRGARAAAS